MSYAAGTCIWLTIVLAWTDHPWAALGSASVAIVLLSLDLRRVRRHFARPSRLAGPRDRERLPGAGRTSSGSLGPAWNFTSARRRSH